jgi:hypothetical protein
VRFEVSSHADTDIPDRRKVPVRKVHIPACDQDRCRDSTRTLHLVSNILYGDKHGTRPPTIIEIRIEHLRTFDRSWTNRQLELCLHRPVRQKCMHSSRLPPIAPTVAITRMSILLSEKKFHPPLCCYGSQNCADVIGPPRVSQRWSGTMPRPHGPIRIL